MGRYKGRRRYYKKRRKGGKDNGDENAPNSFSPTEQMLVRQYLLDYRAGCERVCQQLNATGVPAQKGASPADATSAAGMDDNKCVLIGDQQFLPLTEEAFRKPYLELPRTLTAKHRRSVHQHCVEGTCVRLLFCMHMCICVLAGWMDGWYPLVLPNRSMSLSVDWTPPPKKQKATSLSDVHT